jgi:hypothetical protein
MKIKNDHHLSTSLIGNIKQCEAAEQAPIAANA